MPLWCWALGETDRLAIDRYDLPHVLRVGVLLLEGDLDDGFDDDRA